MRRIIALSISLIILITMLTSCFALPDIFESLGGIENGSSEGSGNTSDDNENGNEDGSEDGNKDSNENEVPDNELPDDEQPDKPSVYIYNAFTASEKKLLVDTLGALIPFVPNNEYYLEEYSIDFDDYYEIGVNYYTYGNTQAEFDAYREQLQYTFDGIKEDEYGDIWYYYTSDEGFYLDICYYYIDDTYIIDAYAYVHSDYDDNGSGGNGSGGNGSDDNGSSGNGGNGSGGNGSSGDNSGSGGSGDNGGSGSGYDLMTNEGAGLPDGTKGVYDVDFTDGKYVTDVTDQGYYLDGCPTVGSPAVLVIPVEFSDATAKNMGCSIDKILTAFCGKSGTTDYFSVDEYYYISSYGRLDLDITVLDQWFRPERSSSYYENLTDADGYLNGDQVILDEALEYLAGRMDLSKFDSDGNGIIDAVVMINTLEVDAESDFNWAYRYWNYYTDNEGYYYEYDGVSANDYLWASYFFMQESYDEDGDVYYTDSSVMNTYTFIHEFGHILGADDYYNTAESGEHPMDGCDIMDGMCGDHNPYSKFNYGWVTTSRLVTTKSSVTLTLDSFTESGDSIIIANNWDEELGAYQEYYVVVYYTMSGLNGGEYGYFSRDGIIVYHINSTLYREEYEGEIYYDVYNTNTDPSDEYGTKDNLVEFVKSAEGNFTYVEGDSLPTVTDDLGNRLGYTFTVDSLTEDCATITFTKK